MWLKISLPWWDCGYFAGVYDNLFGLHHDLLVSYIFSVQTTGESPWTHPPDDAVNLRLSSSTGLTRLDAWYATNIATLPADADHYMLITRYHICLA